MGGGGVNFHEFCKNETPHNPRLPWFTWFAGYYVSSWFAQCAPKRIAAAGSYVKKKKYRKRIMDKGIILIKIRNCSKLIISINSYKINWSDCTGQTYTGGEISSTFK